MNHHKGFSIWHKNQNSSANPKRRQVGGRKNNFAQSGLDVTIELLLLLRAGCVLASESRESPELPSLSRSRLPEGGGRSFAFLSVCRRVGVQSKRQRRQTFSPPLAWLDCAPGLLTPSVTNPKQSGPWSQPPRCGLCPPVCSTMVHTPCVISQLRQQGRTHLTPYWMSLLL